MGERGEGPIDPMGHEADQAFAETDPAEKLSAKEQKKAKKDSRKWTAKKIGVGVAAGLAVAAGAAVEGGAIDPPKPIEDQRVHTPETKKTPLVIAKENYAKKILMKNGYEPTEAEGIVQEEILRLIIEDPLQTQQDIDMYLRSTERIK